MSFTSNSAARRFRFTIGVAACLLIGLVHGQDTQNSPAGSLQRFDFQRIAVLLQTLDERAQACLQEMNAQAGDVTTTHCQLFLAAVDGETVADYLRLCRQARTLRDDIVTTSRAQPLPADQRDSTLQHLLDTEYYCGDGALQQRTDYVFPAFAALNPASVSHRGEPQSGNQSRARRSDATGLIPIQPRLQEETNRLWQDLQLELLRQQITRPGN